MTHEYWDYFLEERYLDFKLDIKKVHDNSNIGDDDVGKQKQKKN